MKRKIFLLVLLAVAAGVAARFLSIDLLRPRIQDALEKGLGRKVDVGGVHLNIFGVPGFTLDEVTIHEDPRAGAEPFAYVESLNARVRFLSLFRKRLEFSSLNFGDATLNLVKTDAGPWNYQFLLASTVENEDSMPALQIRGGRVNFKFGDTKSVFYFNDADLDIQPLSSGQATLRFGGVPSRTDRAQQDFGHFFVRGVWSHQGSGQRLDLNVELERSSLAEVLRLFNVSDLGSGSHIALEAQISGTPSEAVIAGQFTADAAASTGLLGLTGGWRLPFAGKLRLRTEELELESRLGGAQVPFKTALQVTGLLSSPRWRASASLNGAPMPVVAEIAKRLGTDIATKLPSESTVSGSVEYSEEQGWAANLEGQMPEGASGPDGAPPPTPPGTWKGWVKLYQGDWSGEGEVQNIPVTVDGLAEPVRLQSAAASIAAGRVTVNRIRARVGKLTLTGDYRWDASAARPHRLRLTLPEANLAEVERILLPTLAREGGLLARTLGMAPSEIPAWLRDRRMDLTLTPGVLSAAGVSFHMDPVHALWDGPVIRIDSLSGQSGDASWDGSMTLKLNTNLPQYLWEGTLTKISYKGGNGDFEGSIEASGLGAQLLTSLKARGDISARGLTFSADTDFKTFDASVEVQGGAAGPRWKLSNIEAVEGQDTYTGTGASQSDGRLSLDLNGRGRQLKLLLPMGLTAQKR